MKFSVIIPIYNESKTIERCLAQLKQLPSDFEILFADGGSSDDTLQKINGAYPVLSCPKGRANQMNYAAQQATGDYLWFLHCDSQIPANASALLEEAARQQKPWGCFHIAFDYHGPFMNCNTFLSNRRAKKGIAFGDQGIWVQRELFQKIGGFPALPIMEDYEFSLQMRQQQPITVLPASITTSGRRYQSRFPLWTMWQMFYLRCLYRAGVDINEIARRYKDIR